MTKQIEPDIGFDTKVDIEFQKGWHQGNIGFYLCPISNYGFLFKSAKDGELMFAPWCRIVKVVEVGPGRRTWLPPAAEK